DVGRGDRVADRTHVEAGRARGVGGAAVRAQPDGRGDATVVQVERMRVALAAVADDGDAAVREYAAVRVRGLEDPDGTHSGLPPVSVCGSTGTTAASAMSSRSARPSSSRRTRSRGVRLSSTRTISSTTPSP